MRSDAGEGDLEATELDDEEDEAGADLSMSLSF
jgi:hypothetical protein